MGITPASTTKLVTAVASLASLGPDARLSTRVVRGSSPGSIILVGGGDPTLAGPRSSGDPLYYPQPTSLSSLARLTAKALKAAGVTKVTVAYDDSLYTGPRTASTWKPNYVPEGSVAPVTALMVDEGRVSPNSHQRVSDPSRVARGRSCRCCRSTASRSPGPPDGSRPRRALRRSPGSNPRRSTPWSSAP
ncbi:D-alanyl-D-alanine carboxypeptidase [Streptosporangium lutulentum]